MLSSLRRLRHEQSSSYPRGRHERLPSIDDDDTDGDGDGDCDGDDDVEAGITQSNVNGTIEVTSNPNASDDPDHQGRRTEAETETEATPSPVSPSNNNTRPSISTPDDDDTNVHPQSRPGRNTQLHRLQRLSDQNETYKNTTHIWTILISLLLLRIWLEALIAADIGLIAISLVCTSYFMRWKSYRQGQAELNDERVEFLTRLANHGEGDHDHDDDTNYYDDDDDDDDDYVLNGNEIVNENNNGTDRNRNSNSTRTRIVRNNINSNDEDEEVGLNNRARRRRRHNENILRMALARDDHVDFEMLSFQAQLALALMESEQMMQNGVSNRQQQQQQQQQQQNHQSQGVMDSTKLKWLHFHFTTEHDFHALVQKENLDCNDDGKHHCHHHQQLTTSTSSSNTKGDDEEEAPSCCICLCEYEEGEKAVQLPCKHIFHSNCIENWTQNHSTCPLCNAELEAVSSTNEK